MSSAKLEGRVLKNYNGYYYVHVAAENRIYTCKVRGRMKQNRFSLATGDLVHFEAESGGKGMIVSVLPRRNFLLRPTIANLDLFVATLAAASPDFSWLLADKLLALAEHAGVPAVLAVNKIDLAPSGLLEEIRQVYAGAGYEVYFVSAEQGTGIEELRARLKGSICAFGGPSGAGKSSTINAVDSTVRLRTGSVSEKIGRGRHTTRYAQLLPFAGGFIADTPGFGNIQPDSLTAEELPACFREFAAYEGGCRFRPCTHTHEPVCGIKNAVAEGAVAASRYESYRSILQEIKELQEKEGKKQWL